MYSKIAAKNIRKSFKDFTIYFLTLTFAVCIFYCFNSLDSQMALSNMKGIQVSYVGVMNQLMAGVSVFVSVILAGLIIFATNLLTLNSSDILLISTSFASFNSHFLFKFFSLPF